MLQGVVDTSLIHGLRPWPNGLVLSHLRYANDTLMLLDCSSENVQNTWLFLKLYELVSCARINMAKSRIIGINYEASQIQDWALWLNCEIDHLPTKYLGLPLIDDNTPRSLWDPLIQRAHHKLDGWKSRFLSFAGQTTLVKATFSNIPIYYFSGTRSYHQEVRAIKAQFHVERFPTKKQVSTS
ncbi:uncharacterized protein LOC105421724 [Amborella trichopoda]|uniref:uncharacterized protein LOC105421724 n=1 Tax=Amborella trichopoda TaxID=13333 RepID=UPI0005D312BC|nr:uncharacterized protein LOC105421724 [Amborella trichopoda]|eukprot:XP_011628498.1 uncharacterized protein LOC105421724 [Amborella trichopoda]